MFGITFDIKNAKNYKVEDYKIFKGEKKPSLSKDEIIELINNFTNGGYDYIIELSNKAIKDTDEGILKIKDSSASYKYSLWNYNKRSLEAWCKKNDPRKAIYYVYEPSIKFLGYEINDFLSLEYYGSYTRERLSLLEVGERAVLRKLKGMEESHFINNNEDEIIITEIEEDYPLPAQQYCEELGYEIVKEENPVLSEMSWVGTSTRAFKRLHIKETRLLYNFKKEYDEEIKKINDKYKEKFKDVYKQIKDLNS